MSPPLSYLDTLTDLKELPLQLWNAVAAVSVVLVGLILYQMHILLVQQYILSKENSCEHNASLFPYWKQLSTNLIWRKKMKERRRKKMAVLINARLQAQNKYSFVWLVSLHQRMQLWPQILPVFQRTVFFAHKWQKWTFHRWRNPVQKVGGGTNRCGRPFCVSVAMTPLQTRRPPGLPWTPAERGEELAGRETCLLAGCFGEVWAHKMTTTLKRCNTDPFEDLGNILWFHFHTRVTTCSQFVTGLEEKSARGLLYHMLSLWVPLSCYKKNYVVHLPQILWSLEMQTFKTE